MNPGLSPQFSNVLKAQDAFHFPLRHPQHSDVLPWARCLVVAKWLPQPQGWHCHTSSQVGRKKRAVRKYAFLLSQRKSFPRSPPVGFSLNLFDQNWVTWPREAGKVHIRKESARGKMGLGLYPQGFGGGGWAYSQPKLLGFYEQGRQGEWQKTVSFAQGDLG